MKDFKDIEAFIAQLRLIQTEMPRTIARCAEVGAEIILKEVREEIGNYQSEAGPFAAWQELAEATKADRVRKGYTENDPLLREGDLRDSYGMTARGNESAVGSNSDIAVYQELGTEKIPARSALGGSAFRKAETIIDAIGGRVAWTLRGLPTRND